MKRVLTPLGSLAERNPFRYNALVALAHHEISTYVKLPSRLAQVVFGWSGLTAIVSEQPSSIQ